jgi:ABC-2 type transport system ATP-binding protein
MPLTSPAIRFDAVSKRFGKAQVLRSVSFDVPEAAAFALAGENGAGKTTLIKCLLDFCHPEGGSITIGEVSSRQPHSRRSIAFLPERFTPPWYLTGRQFLSGMQRMGERAWNETAGRDMLAALGLSTDALEKPVRNFSKGMNQKLGLAACLLSGRRLLVLDEPMTGLDPSARYRVKELLRRAREQGSTLLITSHSLADVEEICDHMAVLHRGEVAFTGQPAALRERSGERSLEGAVLKCIGEAPNA